MRTFITGSMTGNAIAAHPDVRKLGFTGSTEIGQVIMRTCADSNLKKVSLELGGKSPLVIFADCDLDKAVRLVSYIPWKRMLYTLIYLRIAGNARCFLQQR